VPIRIFANFSDFGQSLDTIEILDSPSILAPAYTQISLKQM